MAFTMIWAYFSFSQMLIIWSGNLPEEVGFFVDRIGPVEAGVDRARRAALLPAFRPPALARHQAQQQRRCRGSPILMLVASWLDLYWYIAATLHPELGAAALARPRCCLSLWWASGPGCSSATSPSVRCCRSTILSCRSPRRETAHEPAH
jgi:hypothetical protein